MTFITTITTFDNIKINPALTEERVEARNLDETKQKAELLANTLKSERGHIHARVIDTREMKVPKSMSNMFKF